MKSIESYNLPERIKTYDADMDIMHPNRVKMADILLDFLPGDSEDSLRALDLGTGSGYLVDRFLRRFTAGRATGVDSSKPMLELAQARLGELSPRMSCCEGDCRQLTSLVEGPFDVVFTAYALHHLDAEAKTDVVAQSLSLLKPGGWFFNADLVVAQEPAIEARIQELRVRGIVERADGRDQRFASTATTRAYLDKLEAEDGDQPLTLHDELAVLSAAGGVEVALLWVEHREAVTCCRQAVS